MKRSIILSSIGLAALIAMAPTSFGAAKAAGNLVTDPTRDYIVYDNENGTTLKINDPDDPKNSNLREINIINKDIQLFVDSDNGYYEEQKINFNVVPYGAPTAGFKFKCSNTRIATVTDDGVVKGKSEGVVTVTLSNADGSIKDTCRVIVNKSTLASTVGERKDQIMDYQSKNPMPDNIFVTETYDSNTSVVGGEVIESYKFTEKFWISKKNNYFRITSEDAETLCSNGTPVLDRNDYIFYTDDLYFTYIIKTDGAKRNYMVIDQSSLMNKKSKFDCMCDAIGNFFTAGRKIVDQQYDYFLGTSTFNDDSIWSSLDYCGALPESKDSTQLAIEYSSTSAGRLNASQAESFELPAGTYITLTDTIKECWINNYCCLKQINEKIDYTLGEVDYLQNFDVNYYFESIEESELLKPDLSKYTKVTSIFDL